MSLHPNLMAPCSKCSKPHLPLSSCTVDPVSSPKKGVGDLVKKCNMPPTTNYIQLHLPPSDTCPSAIAFYSQKIRLLKALIRNLSYPTIPLYYPTSLTMLLALHTYTRISRVEGYQRECSMEHGAQLRGLRCQKGLHKTWGQACQLPTLGLGGLGVQILLGGMWWRPHAH